MVERKIGKLVRTLHYSWCGFLPIYISQQPNHAYSPGSTTSIQNSPSAGFEPCTKNVYPMDVFCCCSWMLCGMSYHTSYSSLNWIERHRLNHGCCGGGAWFGGGGCCAWRLLPWRRLLWRSWLLQWLAARCSCGGGGCGVRWRRLLCCCALGRR
jgi:hypothetical protein